MGATAFVLLCAACVQGQETPCHWQVVVLVSTVPLPGTRAQDNNNESSILFRGPIYADQI